MERGFIFNIFWDIRFICIQKKTYRKSTRIKPGLCALYNYVSLIIRLIMNSLNILIES